MNLVRGASSNLGGIFLAASDKPFSSAEPGLE
jgi:hypothetical protein